MGDCIFGLVGKDYVLMAGDLNAARSIIVFKDDEDKIMKLDKHKLLAASGPTGDRVAFTEFVQKNIHLYELKNDIPLTVHAAAAWTRNELAEALRRGPYQVNLLLGGYDEKHGPSLYFMDYLASMQPVPFGVHGYAAYFCLSVFDRYYRKDMNLAEGIGLLQKCVDELRVRFLLNMPKFNLKIADKDGVRDLDWGGGIAPVAPPAMPDAAAAGPKIDAHGRDMKADDERDVAMKDAAAVAKK